MLQLYIAEDLTGSNETHTFQLVAGDGDDDNATFTIENGELKANKILRYEDQAQYKSGLSHGQGRIDL